LLYDDTDICVILQSKFFGSPRTQCYGEGISEDIARQMLSDNTKTKDGRYIGLGWFIYDPLGNGEYAISYGGDDPGAHSICFLLPKSGQGIIIFTNSENGTKLYIDLIKAYLAEKGQAILDIELK
jgi:hypothetical protein